jgi:hypothetical protein
VILPNHHHQSITHFVQKYQIRIGKQETGEPEDVVHSKEEYLMKAVIGFWKYNYHEDYISLEDMK